ncbi:argininosuccinate lyase, partial [bacterium]|nr:argininosuccinate lyase [bacterium]
MKKPVWHNQEKGTARETFVAFSAGRDVTGLPMADEMLIPYDIWTNQAHAKMLNKVGVYSSEECQQVIQALNELKRQWENSNWRLDPVYEDVHINIEAYIAEVCGEGIGGKLHSGRSRNDQVATDMKLYARDALISLVEETVFLITALVELAKDHLQTVMPGYTHHRKATLTSWAHWCAAYAQALYRDAVRMRELSERINTCPLGAAASFGTTWPIDRDVTADLLAFRAIQENTLDAVMARGEAEWEIVQAASVLLKHLSCFSQDLILFSTEEFGYLGLPAAFTTGSSIMPQKRNPDFAEAIKAKAHAVQGYAQALGGINTANLFGYNKDVQWTKYQFMDAMRETQNAAEILSEVLPNLVVHADIMEKAARTGFLNAVDVADY